MVNQDSLAAKIAKEGVAAILLEGLKWGITWLSPWILTVMTVLAGYQEGVQWAYIIPLATIVFAATAVGLLRFDEWIFRRTPSDKLEFENISLGLDFVRDPTSGQPTAISRAQIGIVLKSSAHFPISYIVDDLRTSIEKRVNPNPIINTRGAIVGTTGHANYNHAPIDMDNSPLKPVLEGTAEFKLRYGRIGSEKYVITKKMNINCPYDPVAHTYTVAWADAPQ